MTVLSINRVPTWEFCDRLRKARRLAGLQQREVADALGVKIGRYGHWESGLHVPEDLIGVCKIVSGLTGVPAWWLAGLDDGPDGSGLPHLDSNQKPFGCGSENGEHVIAPVIKLRRAA